MTAASASHKPHRPDRPVLALVVADEPPAPVDPLLDVTTDGPLRDVAHGTAYGAEAGCACRWCSCVRVGLPPAGRQLSDAERTAKRAELIARAAGVDDSNSNSRSTR